MGNLPEWKMMVSLWWVTYLDERWLSHYNGSQMKDDCLIMMGDLPRWKMMGDLPKWKVESDLPGKKTWLEKSWQDKANKLSASWLQGWLEDFSLLMIGLISLFF